MTAVLDSQARDLLEACYERNIHSRGDMEYAFQPWALNVDRLRKVLEHFDVVDYHHDLHGVTMKDPATPIAAEYARLSELDR